MRCSAAQEGQGFFQLMSDLPYERTIIGVSALAAMEGAYAATLDYVRDRKAFGKPIAEFQNTKLQARRDRHPDQGGPRLHRPLRRRPGGRHARHRHRLHGEALGHRAAGPRDGRVPAAASAATAT
jgi:hypothetical protein